MDVEVDVGKQDGEALTTAARKEPAWSTRAFEPAHDEVDALIGKIIQANLASDAVSYTHLSPAAPSSRHPVHGFFLANPTITEVVQWKIDDSLDMHQLTSLCRNIW